MQLVDHIRKRKQTELQRLNIVNKNVDKQITKVQARWRGYIQRKKFKKMILKKKRKEFISIELLTSQRSYCQHIQFLISKVMQPCKKMIGNDFTHQMMFKNLPGILKLHKNFLTQLEIIMKSYQHHFTCLSKILRQHLIHQDFQKIYTSYCANYGRADQQAKNLENNNIQFNTYLKKLQKQLQSFTLQSFLIKPVQRMCKYKLIFGQYLKNMNLDHIDYEQMSKVTIQAEQIVNKTNKDVQQFLFRQKLIELQKQYINVFTKFPNVNRKILFQVDDIKQINLIKQEQHQLKQIIIMNDSILIIGQSPIMTFPLLVRQLPNLKYFKNLVQIIDPYSYYIIEFKKQNKKETFLQIIQSLPKKNDFMTVNIVGTQNRQSFLKVYTVYIVQIHNGKTISTIYPRFKQLIKVQSFLASKGIVTRAPHLQRENIVITLKSKTIQKRKLIIQEFLQRIINIPKTNKYRQQIYSMLKISSCTECQLSAEYQRKNQIKIFLPNMQKVVVHVNIKCDKIKDLKKIISTNIGLQENGQFQLFQVRDKVRKLMYEEQSVAKIFQEQDSIINAFNPFKQQTQYLFTRHYYLTNQEQHSLYKQDFVRTQLQLAVIRSQIINYRLQQQLMVTFMCLFALYANLPIGDDQKVMSFIKEIGQKQYKVSLSDFKIYLSEVQKRLAFQQDQFITIPFVIIKIMNNSTLYRCQQFQVKIHEKQLRELQKYIKGVQQKMILGIKRSGILLITTESKHIIQSFTFDNLTKKQIHHTAIVFEIQGIKNPMRLLTTQSYQISILVDIYNGKKKLS